MEEKYKSTLSLIKYTVNELVFKKNNEYNGDNVNIDFKINKDIKYENDIMIVNLITYIFKDSVQKNFPFEMKVNIEGRFKIEGNVTNEWEPNAIAILYPYIRAIVSNYTANANINSLILPIININKYIQDCEEND